MHKVYCNFCEKEIKKINEVWDVKLQAGIGNPRVSYNADIKDLCEHCAMVLHCCICMLPKGWNPDFHELGGGNK